jgi:hypothetical protein
MNVSSLYAKICAAIYAIKFAYARGCTNIWLQCDFLLLVQAFTNCLHTIRNFQFRFSHIYREGNTCADRLANAGFFVNGLVWWDQLPSCSRESFFRDRVGLSNYRFR